MADVKETVPLLVSTRFWVLLLWFYGSVSAYMIRVNMGVSVVCMTTDSECNATDSNKTHVVSNVEQSQTGQFCWDRATRGILNSAFFYGYILAHIPGGLLAQKYGAKWVHFGGMALGTAGTILSPVSADGSKWTLLVCRIIVGIGCGVFIPTMRQMINGWSPVSEKSVMASVQGSGYSLGSMVAFCLLGLSCSNLGWQSTFYIPTVFTGLYLILFAIFGSNGPESYKFISEKERTHIMKERSKECREDVFIPWVSIFTSLPCICLFVCEFCSAWGRHTILTSVVQYMNDVLDMDIEANGLFNALPPVSKFIMTICGGVFFDFIIARLWLSKTNARKLAQSLGFMVPATLMVCIGFMSSDKRRAAIIMLCVAEAFTGLTRSGLLTICLEVAPRYASIISGVQSTFGTVSGIISPMLVGFLTPSGAQTEWQRVFIIQAAVYTFGCITFLALANAEVQQWAKDPPKQEPYQEMDIIIIRL